MIKARYAILVDGGFLTKKLQAAQNKAPSADDIEEFCKKIQGLDILSDYELLRIYFYDAYPSSERLKKPASKDDMNLSLTERYRHSQQLFDQLVLRPNFSLRMGEVIIAPNKWNIKHRAWRALLKDPRPLTDEDFELAISQKGVDMRVGMDMARLALRDMVRLIVVVTGDSDFVPAFKFVRREGVRVALAPLGHNVRVELRQHSDIVLDLQACETKEQKNASQS